MAAISPSRASTRVRNSTQPGTYLGSPKLQSPRREEVHHCPHRAASRSGRRAKKKKHKEKQHPLQGSLDFREGLSSSHRIGGPLHDAHLLASSSSISPLSQRHGALGPPLAQTNQRVRFLCPRPETQRPPTPASRCGIRRRQPPPNITFAIRVESSSREGSLLLRRHHLLFISQGGGQRRR